MTNLWVFNLCEEGTKTTIRAMLRCLVWAQPCTCRVGKIREIWERTDDLRKQNAAWKIQSPYAGLQATVPSSLFYLTFSFVTSSSVFVLQPHWLLALPWAHKSAFAPGYLLSTIPTPHSLTVGRSLLQGDPT